MPVQRAARPNPLQLYVGIAGGALLAAYLVGPIPLGTHQSAPPPPNVFLVASGELGHGAPLMGETLGATRRDLLRAQELWSQAEHLPAYELYLSAAEGALKEGERRDGADIYRELAFTLMEAADSHARWIVQESFRAPTVIATGPGVPLGPVEQGAASFPAADHGWFIQLGASPEPPCSSPLFTEVYSFVSAGRAGGSDWAVEALLNLRSADLFACANQASQRGPDHQSDDPMRVRDLQLQNHALGRVQAIWEAYPPEGGQLNQWLTSVRFRRGANKPLPLSDTPPRGEAP